MPNTFKEIEKSFSEDEILEILEIALNCLYKRDKIHRIVKIYDKLNKFMDED